MIQGKMSCLMINDLDAGVGRFGGLFSVHVYFSMQL